MKQESEVARQRAIFCSCYKFMKPWILKLCALNNLIQKNYLKIIQLTVSQINCTDNLGLDWMYYLSISACCHSQLPPSGPFLHDFGLVSRIGIGFPIVTCPCIIIWYHWCLFQIKWFLHILFALEIGLVSWFSVSREEPRNKTEIYLVELVPWIRRRNMPLYHASE